MLVFVSETILAIKNSVDAQPSIRAQHVDEDYSVFHLILNDYSYTSVLC